MQEEVEQKSFNIVVSTTKLTARTILNAGKAAIQQQQAKMAGGKQSVRMLLRQNRGVSSVEIDKTNIKESKFVVVDLTHQNNGAYFEEGYAMGLGKPVIQLCKDGEELHFDIKQKNTILWKSEDEIAERLKRRILATIE